MPPPNFARKKRKSRSRGASAKRAPRHKSQVNSSIHENPKGCPQRSSSVDDQSACCSNSQKESSNTTDALSSGAFGTLNSTQIKIKESSPILSLANEVAAAAIVTAGKVIKDSSTRQINTPNKKAKGSSSSLIKGCSKTSVEKSKGSPHKNTKAENHLNPNSAKMVIEDEKLNDLCKLLDRLDTKYGSDSLTNSPSKVIEKTKFIDEGKNIVSSSSQNSSAKTAIKVKPNSGVNSIPKVQVLNSVINENDKNVELSQEEKQAMRKAKKEAKKQGTKNVSDIDQKVPIENKVIVNSCNPPAVPKSKDTDKIASPPLAKQEVTEKIKTDLKRERREKQEAQRAAKAAAAKSKSDEEKKKDQQVLPPKEVDSTQKKKSIIKKKDVSNGIRRERRLPLLEHLAAQRDQQVDFLQCVIHPAIRVVGLCMRDGTIDGCNARVLATLSAICSLIDDYKTPPSCDMSRDLSEQVSPNIAFLNACRQIPEPMNNAIRFVKKEINEVDRTLPEAQAKGILLEAIETYIYQNIILASETIVVNAQDFVEDKDVIVTFGCSSLIYETIKIAVKSKEKLSVIIVDTPNPASGSYLLSALLELGVSVYYRLLPDLPHIISKVTKVIIEAEAVVLNGAVMGFCGMAGLALLASSHGVPVIVFSHTYKFCNIDLTDSLVVNELGDSEDIVNCPCPKYNKILKNWRDTSSLNVVNLVYDVTPAELVNVLVTERNNFPTSVVPVIIKRNYADILGHD